MISRIIILLLIASPAFGDTYSWVDNQGVMHFTDRSENVPSKNVKKTPAQTYQQKTTSDVPNLPLTGNWIVPGWGLKVGMHINKVLSIHGEPLKVNTTKGVHGTREQYVFEQGSSRWYVYADNNLVTHWQY